MPDMSASTAQHKQIAAQQGPINIGLVTVSDTRTPETDTNGQYLREQITGAGHIVVDYLIIKDEPDQVAATLDTLAASAARVVIFNGGTGIAARDTTIDVIARKLEKTLPGFGEIFRMLSYEQVGAAAILSRATAGVYRNKVIICTPGSSKAVQLAWEKIIAPELAHLAWEVVR